MDAEKTTETLEEIYEQTNKNLRYFTLKHSRSPGEMEDVIQCAYLSLFKRMRRGGKIQDPLPYLLKTVKRELYKRRLFRKHEIMEIPVFSPWEGEVFDGLEAEMLQEIHPVDEETANEIWEYLKGRDMLTFQIFALHFFYDMKIKEVAAELKISESTVKNRMYRTIKDIRNHIQY